MPHLLDTSSHTDAVLAAANRLILRHGVRALTLRAVAREARLSPASLVHHFTNAERLDRVLGRRFGHGWSDRQALGSRLRGLHALVPGDDDERDAARLWLGWCEVARGRPTLAPALAGVRGELRGLVATLLADHGDRACLVDEVDVDLTVAVVEGLAAACCAPDEPLTSHRAAAALSRFLDQRERCRARAKQNSP